jgi:hypothetical protein
VRTGPKSPQNDKKKQAVYDDTLKAWFLCSASNESGNITGHKLTFHSPFYNFPYSSEILQVGIYEKSCRRFSGILPSMKAICISIDNGYVLFPIRKC